MKKILTIALTIFLLSSAASLFAAESNLDLKIGGSYPKDPEKIGFDGGANLNIGIDKFFAFGVEAGFTWVSWEVDAGEKDFANVTLPQKVSYDIYMVPILVNAQVRFDQREEMGIMPYIVIGGGYGWTWVTSSDDTETFSGLTYQALVGCAFRPGEGSKIDVIVEAGYRGTNHKNSDDFEIDMSGVVVHVGVRFPIGGMQDDF